MHKNIALSLLLALFAARSYAMPEDWCVRPDARDYQGLELQPGSKAKEVVYPRGQGGISDYRQTYALSRDGLLETIRTEFSEQSCLETFTRNAAGLLLSRKTACSPKPTSGIPTTYRYRPNGWSETNGKGTEVTTLEPFSKFGATWRLHRQNLDRTWPSPPGSFVMTHLDNSCREVGPSSFMEMRADRNGLVAGPTITQERSISARQNGYQQTTTRNGLVRDIALFDAAGFLTNEQFFEPHLQSRPFAVRVTLYSVDERGNWTSRRTTHRNFQEGGQPTEEGVERTVSYHP